MQVDINGHPRSEHVSAKDARFTAVLDGFLQGAIAAPIFETQIDVGGARPDRVAGDGDPLDQLVRIIFHQHAVVEGARLTFVGVDGKINRAGMILGEK